MNNKSLLITLLCTGLSAFMPMIAMEGNLAPTKRLKLDSQVNEKSLPRENEQSFHFWEILPKDLKGEIIIKSLSSQLNPTEFDTQLNVLKRVNKEINGLVRSKEKEIEDIKKSLPIYKCNYLGCCYEANRKEILERHKKKHDEPANFDYAYCNYLVSCCNNASQ